MNRTIGERNVLVVAITIIALTVAPARSSGSAKQFLPKITGYNGEFEIGAMRENNENTTAGRGLKTSDTVFKQDVLLRLFGNIYHPRFILYRFKGRFGAQQQKFTNSNGQVSRTTPDSDEYDFRTLVLPEHPYNLELFTRRRRPLVRSRVQVNYQPVIYEKGGFLRYRKRPLFFELSSIDSSTSGGFDSDSQVYRASASHVAPRSKTTGTYTHSATISRSGGTRSSLENYFLSNILTFDGVRLESRAEGSEQEQTITSGIPIDVENFFWAQRLSARLPWKLDASATYSHMSSLYSSELTAGQRRAAVFSETDGASLLLTHRIYDSLRTQFRQNYNSTASTGGRFRDNGWYLISDYTKKIPGGSLSTGLSLNRMIADRNGALPVIDESHQAPIGGAFQLNEERIDESAIVVRVREPAPSNTIVVLEKNIHYAVSTVGTRTTITILSLPQPPFALGSDYSFLVSYSAAAASVELLTTGGGYNVRLSLFGNFFNPYYIYSSSEQEVLTGFIPGGPDYVRSRTVGILLQKFFYSLLAEYNSTRSRLNPSRTWKTLVTVNKEIAHATDLTGKASHTSKDYQETESIPESSQQSWDETLVGVTLTKLFPRKKLNITGGLSFIRRVSGIDTETVNFNVVITRKIGKLDMNLGVAIDHSESDTRSGKQIIASEYYYLLLKRKLF